MCSLAKYDSSWQEKIPPDMSLGTMYAEREKHITKWHSSKACQQTEDIASRIFRKQSILENPTLKVSSCICLGLGSFFSYGNVEIEQSPERKTSDGLNDLHMGQLVAFEHWVKILRKFFDVPNVYFQDPTFNALDKAFLTSLGYQVIKSPASNTVLTDESFVFAPGLGPDVVYNTLKKAYPAIWIGPKLDHRLDISEYEERLWKANPFIRDLESGFLKSRESIQVMRSSAWEAEDYDDERMWASMYFLR